MIGVTIVIRVLHLGAAIALMGSWTFPLLIVRPALQQAGQRDWAAWPHFDRLLLRVGGWSLVGFGGASVLGFWDQCMRVTQRSFVTLPSWEELGSFLMDTRYGRVWLLRLLLAVLLGGVLFVSTRRHHGPSREILRLAGALLASVLLGAQSWTGHAAAAEGVELSVQIGLDVVHLVAAGVWLGGLPLLALLLTWAQRANQASAECMAAAATRRFSALGLGSVLLLVLTGMARTWGLVGSVPALIGTPYGQLLLGKVGLLLLLLLPATINVWYDKPFLLRMVAEQRRQQTREALRRLRRNVLLEMVGGCALLVVVGGLGVHPPARHVSPSWPLAFRLSWNATKDIPGVRSQVLLGSSMILISLLAVGYAIGGHRWRWPAVGGVSSGSSRACGSWARPWPLMRIPPPMCARRCPTRPCRLPMACVSTRSIAWSVMGSRAMVTAPPPQRSTPGRPTLPPNTRAIIQLATCSGGSPMALKAAPCPDSRTSSPRRNAGI